MTINKTRELGLDQANVYKLLMLAGFQAIVSVADEKKLGLINRRQNQKQLPPFAGAVTFDDDLIAIGVTDEGDFHVIDRTLDDVPWNQVEYVADGDDDNEFCPDGIGEAITYGIFLVSKARLNRAFIASGGTAAPMHQ